MGDVCAENARSLALRTPVNTTSLSFAEVTDTLTPTETCVLYSQP